MKKVKANIGIGGFFVKCILQRIFCNKGKNTLLYRNVISIFFIDITVNDLYGHIGN